MNTRRFLAPIVSLIATIAVLAQQPSALQLDVSPAKLQQHVSYLASDALDGRRTGTTGANDAARYLAGEFSRLGLKPGIQNARTPEKLSEAMPRYLQPFPYVSSAELGRGNSLSLRNATGTREFSVQTEWIPLGYSANQNITNVDLVFAGYGISSTALKYDDYLVTNAKDRVVWVFEGTPDGNNPHGQFINEGQVRFKIAAARAAGARALLIVSAEENFSENRLARLHYDNGGDAGIPVAVISRGVASEIVGSSLTVFESATDPRPLTTPSTTEGYSVAAALRSPPKNTVVSIMTDVVRREVPAYNVIGILEGSHPTLKNEVIIIGAHYDHLGRGGQGSLAQREGEIHHGADDNASGTAGLLELARIFTSKPFRPKRTIMFIGFSGEEEGLLGSKHYVNNPMLPLANTVAMLNMDMIGRMKDKNLVISGVGTAKEWRDIINSNNYSQTMTVSATNGNADEQQARGMPIVTSANGRPIVTTLSESGFNLTLRDDGLGPSDHASFYLKQVPVLFFWTGTHLDYHKPSDTFEKINYEDQARVVRLVGRIIRELDNAEKRITFTTAKSDPPRTGGFRVYLGTIPSYTDSNDGLVLDGVRDDSPAAKAGLKAGDKIVKIDNREIKNVYDYTFALGEMKSGQEYTIEAMRGTERLVLKITPAANR